MIIQNMQRHFIYSDLIQISWCNIQIIDPRQGLGCNYERSLSAKRGILISSRAQDHRCYCSFQATPCAAVSNHGVRRLVNYALESCSVTTGCLHKIDTVHHVGVRAHNCLTAYCHYSNFLPENWSTLLQSLLFTSSK